jgi:hypothetical protein
MSFALNSKRNKDKVESVQNGALLTVVQSASLDTHIEHSFRRSIASYAVGSVTYVNVNQLKKKTTLTLLENTN